MKTKKEKEAESVLIGWSSEYCKGLELVWRMHRDLFPMTFADFLQYMSEKVVDKK